MSPEALIALRRALLQADGEWEARGNWLYRDGREQGRLNDSDLVGTLIGLLGNALPLLNEVIRLRLVNADLRSELRDVLRSHPDHRPRTKRR